MNKPHALHNGWPCGSRLQSGIVAFLQFVHWVGPSPTAGNIPPMETLPGLPDAAATAVAPPETPLARDSTARASSTLGANMPDASAYGRTPNRVRS